MNEYNAQATDQRDQGVPVSIPEGALAGDPAPDVPPTNSIWRRICFKIRAAKVELQVQLRGKTKKIIGIGAVLGVLKLGEINGIPFCNRLLYFVVGKTFECMTPGLQKIGQIFSGCLQFELRCFTDARFLEILRDYESGKITQRLNEEFLKAGIKTEELEVEIQNIKEVEETKLTIEKSRRRSYSTEVTTEKGKRTEHLEYLKTNGVASRKQNNFPMFTGREAEIKKAIAFLKDEEKAVVSLHGGPGFGKTAMAIQMSHKLSEDRTILVVSSTLTTATNVDEMIRQLCLDVGINYEDDPKRSLIHWLKNNKKKVILVMDDIDNLLQGGRSLLYHFIRRLLRNSDCQIVTTSRSSYLIPELSIGKVLVGEMEDKECVELLKKQCPQQNDQLLRRLAQLCGNMPLAMCIAGNLLNDLEDPHELLPYLENQPMKTLECPESDQYVNQAINTSYEKYSDEEQETLARLSVFEGSFTTDAAEFVIEKDKFDMSRTLKKFVSLSLIKQPTKHRYSIHLLSKHFLNDKQTCQKLTDAKVRMIEYYLKLGHEFTINSPSEETLKLEAPNIQNVLKLCSEQKDPKTDISDCIASSKIYTTSAKSFSHLARTVTPGSIVDKFLQGCAKIAEKRQQTERKKEFLQLVSGAKTHQSIDRSEKWKK